MDFDDDEILDDSYVPNNESTSSGSNKIKILSNIELPVHTISTVASQDINLEPSSEAEALSNVATGIATSLGVLDSSDDLQYIEGEVNETDPLEGEKSGQNDDVTVTQFITEDGSLSTLQLTSSEKADLVRQMENQEGVVMILNDDFDHSQELIVNNADQQGIVVVYSQPDDGQKQETSSQEEGEGGHDGNGSSIDEDFKMEIEGGGADVPEKKDGKVKSETDVEHSADHSSLDSTFEHSLDEELYDDKTDDDSKEEETDGKEIAEEKDTENDKKSDNGDGKKPTVKKLISEVKDDWFDDEDESDAPKPAEKQEIEKKEKIVTRRDNQPAPSTAKVAAKVEKTYKNSGRKGTETVKASPATEPKSIRTTRNKAESAKQAAKQIVKEKTPSKGDASEEIVESIPKEEQDEDDDDDKNVTDKSAESAEKKESKTDVKTLISADWGDDDF